MSLLIVLWRQDQPQHGLKSTPGAVSVSPSTATDWLIGVLVPPVLLGLLASRAIADGLVQSGLVSEQLLQGQRLPNLNIHRTDVASDDQ